MRISSLLAAILAGLVFQNEGLVLQTPSLQLRPTSLSLRWGRVPLRLRVPRLGNFPARQARPPWALSLTAAADGDNDLNMLQTALHAAIEREDYGAAAQYRDRIKEATDACGAQSGGWESLQVPPWLADRAERLGFRIPTQVQRNALETVMNGRDTVIRSPTGSGKTLAYLMPMLSLLSDDLLDDDIMLHLSRFQSKQDTRGQRVSKLVDQELAPTPLGVIVVPTRELGVQVSTLCYMLVGGSRNNPTICQERIPPRYQPGSRTNMFTYKGPRRVKVVGVWDKEALNASMPVEDYGLNSLKGAHIIVTTPEYLEPLAARGHVPLSNARVVVVDEADTCLSGAAGPVLSDCFAAAHLKSAWAADGTKRVRILAGASILRPQVEEAAAEQMLAEPVTVDDGSEVSDAALVWAKSQRIPANIQHRYLVCDTPSLALGALAKLLRGEIAASQRRGESQPRMIVYAVDAAEALRVSSPLQNSLWTGLGGDIDAGLWGLSVLLPSAEDGCRLSPDNITLLTYESSLRVMEKFYFDQVSLLVTTPLATRGLDFPNITHVFNLGIVGTAADYMHRAGRCGRIGQQVDRGGVCISILRSDEVAMLKALGEELGFEVSEMELTPEEAVTDDSPQEDKIRMLEDTLQLFSQEDRIEGSKD